MRTRLFTKLCLIIGAGTVLLFWAVDILSNQTEKNMSFIAERHKQELKGFALQAEDIYLKHGNDALNSWLVALQQKEKTWAAVAHTQVNPVSNANLDEKFVEGIMLGRSVDWMIHLYLDYNPIMDIAFSSQDMHFLIQLPQRMRPGKYYTFANLVIQFVLPLVLLSALSYMLYHHLMLPLRKLEKATKEFSEGNFDVRINASNYSRNDELTELADTFDKMAERIGKLICTQRQLLSDLSHELRTPLTRIDMAVDFVEEKIDSSKAIERLRYESANMRELVEDALTLAYLDTEQPHLHKERFDLTELISVICEDCRFEYPYHKILAEIPEQTPIYKSSQRALGQAIENLLRNALNYTPPDKAVKISLHSFSGDYIITIEDEGIGVPEVLLEDIFKPFFRVEKSRTIVDNEDEVALGKKRKGFGLGLSLAQRQIKAVNGQIQADNRLADDGSVLGLKISIKLPINKVVTICNNCKTHSF